MAVSAIADTLGTPLLQNDTVAGAIDHRGSPAVRSQTGGWRSAFFIIGVETAERIAYYGVGSNLISYLTGPLGQSTAAAAASVNAWFGVSSLLPLLGAAVADSFLGRFRTIVAASILYILGLGLLTLSAVTWSGLETYQNASNPSNVERLLFFSSLYLVALGQGGHKPCVQAFGADQFDNQNSMESKARSSFFNWWYFGMNIGVLFSFSVLFYIQDRVNWGLGFGIPCMLMSLGLVILLLGRRSYRYQSTSNQISPFERIDRWFEDAQALLKLLPIWLTSMAFAVAFAQVSTFFTKQGVTMDRSVSNFILPAASLQSFTALSIMLTISIYDTLLIPTAVSLTGNPSGITMLQRIGTGMVLSIIAMVVAALVELRRLRTAMKHGLIDSPGVILPISFWWLVPQYVLCGVADAFTMVGLQEFFYSQVPDELRSVGLAFYLSIIGVGSLLSSFAVSVVDGVTGGGGGDSWFSDNLNRGHVDYFYWSLAGLQVAVFGVFLLYSKSYVYRRKVVVV